MRTKLLAALLIVAVAPPVWAQSCEELYFRRNAVYKQAGFCFKTARAIRTFGNAGCQFDTIDDVPLSPRQRRIVGSIAAEERALGCN